MDATAALRPHLARVWQAGYAAGRQAAATFSAPPPEPTPLPVAAQFAAADAPHYRRYVAPDDRGEFPGHLHRLFGCGVKEFAEATGLVRRFAAAGSKVAWRWYAAPVPGAAPDPLAAAGLAAMLEFTRRAHDEGFDPQAGLDAIAAALRDEDDDGPEPDAFASVYDESQHPRDDRGRFVAKKEIEAAHHDPAKADDLRAKVTDPAQREKLEKAIASPESGTWTKRGEQKHRAGQKRERVKASVGRAREIMAGVADGTASRAAVAELADHLPHLSRDHLELLLHAHQEAGPGGRVKASMTRALLAHAEQYIDRAEAEHAAAKRETLRQAVADHVDATPGVTVSDLTARFGPAAREVAGGLVKAGTHALKDGALVPRPAGGPKTPPTKIPPPPALVPQPALSPPIPLATVEPGPTTTPETGNGRTDGPGSGGHDGSDAGTRGAVAEAARRPGGGATDLLWGTGGEPAGTGPARRVPANTAEVNRRLDRFDKFFRARGQHQVADWVGKLRDHVNAVGAEAALEAVGGPGAGSPGGTGDLVQYWGVGTEEANWKNMGAFMERYLARNGIVAVTGDTSAPDFPLVSALGAPDRYVAGQDFKPGAMPFKDKLTEAKHLPGLESSEDIGVVAGKPVTHLTDDVLAKLDERYGKGQWIVKCYDDNAAAGYGIFFPQRAAAIKQDARNTLWTAGENLARYGFAIDRDAAGKATGIKHAGGDVYPFGSERYATTIHGDVRQWGDRAAAAANHENGAMLPEGSFMVQPAFPAVGISDADRAAGKTWHETNEGRVHLVVRDGKAEVIPHTTWLKGGQLPVVFETDDTRAMAKAAQDAINALPPEARSGQVYAPDVMKTANGYRVVELNAQGDYNGSGYLHDNHFTIDSYTSYLAGREPAHVRFIRELLTKRDKPSAPALPPPDPSDDDFSRPRGEPVAARPDLLPQPSAPEGQAREPSLEEIATGIDPGPSGGRRKYDPHSPAPSGRLPEDVEPRTREPASGPAPVKSHPS